MALCRFEDDLALKCWEEALSMKEEHFDTQINYLIYKWKEANISDDELLEELNKDSYRSKHLGQIIRGTVQIAIGQLTEGIETLTTFITNYEDEQDQDGKNRCNYFNNDVQSNPKNSRKNDRLLW